jgi:hypothetical protein
MVNIAITYIILEKKLLHTCRFAQVKFVGQNLKNSQVSHVLNYIARIFCTAVLGPFMIL